MNRMQLGSTRTAMAGWQWPTIRHLHDAVTIGGEERKDALHDQTFQPGMRDNETPHPYLQHLEARLQSGHEFQLRTAFSNHARTETALSRRGADVQEDDAQRRAPKM